jgi:hypothetical protein
MSMITVQAAAGKASTSAQPAKFWPGYGTNNPGGYCISACVHCGEHISRMGGRAYIEIENRTHVICIACIEAFGPIKLANMGPDDA